jgi:hypothetical protein
MTRPQRTEAADEYFDYIDLIPGEDIVSTLQSQMDDTLDLLGTISEEQSLYSYAPGKWTIRQLLNHLSDGERLFVGRAFWFARGFEGPLPSYDQDRAAQMAHANDCSWAQLVEEFKNVRLSTISFFQNLPHEAWSRAGVANDNPVTVRAIAYAIAGHVAHHTNVLKEKYL